MDPRVSGLFAPFAFLFDTRKINATQITEIAVNANDHDSAWNSEQYSENALKALLHTPEKKCLGSNRINSLTASLPPCANNAHKSSEEVMKNTHNFVLLCSSAWHDNANTLTSTQANKTRQRWRKNQACELGDVPKMFREWAARNEQLTPTTYSHKKGLQRNVSYEESSSRTV